MGIDNMEAGRELDAIVAEKVMGWHYDSAWDCLIPPEQRAKPNEMWTEWEADDDGLVRKPINENYVTGIVYTGDTQKIVLPYYSTDIADAWKVVERLDYKSHTNFSLYTIGANWFCFFKEENVKMDYSWVNEYEARADTAPLAICRAALKTVPSPATIDFTRKSHPVTPDARTHDSSHD